MNVYLQKISLLRPNSNPRNKNLSLNLDWATNFNEINNDKIQFDCVLNSSDNFAIDFQIEGILKFKRYENFVKDDVSQFIVKMALEIFYKLISDTRDREFSLNNFKHDEIIYTENKIYGNRILN